MTPSSIMYGNLSGQLPKIYLDRAALFLFYSAVVNISLLLSLVDLFECQKQWIQFVLVKPWPAVYSWSVAREGTRVEPHIEFSIWILQGVQKNKSLSEFLDNSISTASWLLEPPLEVQYPHSNQTGFLKTRNSESDFLWVSLYIGYHFIERSKLKSTEQDTRMFVCYDSISDWKLNLTPTQSHLRLA